MTESQTPPSELPTTNQLIRISTLLKHEPVPKVLSSEPQIPRILLTAAKRGINEDTTSEISGTKAMVNSLLSLSKTSILSKKRDHNLRKPSPFSKTRFAKLDKNQMETITRAATWATTLLTDCIRATSTENHSHLSPVSHTDTAAVFVAPRDTLDPVLAQRYATDATHCLSLPFFRRNLSALTTVQAFLTSTAAVSSQHTTLCLPVLESALSTFASAPCPLHLSEQSSRTLDRVLQQSSASAKAQLQSLAQLSPEAKGILCVQSTLFRATLRQQIERVFSSRATISYISEREAVNPLARAAVIDVNLHWQFMDHVRTLVSGHDAPFSLHLWNERRFFRALFSETVRLIQTKHNLETTYQSLVNRFPPFGRPILRIFSALAGSMRSEDTQKQRMAVSMVTSLIWKMLGFEKSFIWTPNVHAFMICAESLLELLCWATASSLELRSFESTLPKKDRRRGEADPLTCICYLSTLLETSRLPGGELVDSKMQLRATALSLREFLANVATSRHLDLAGAFRENLIGGLSAFALSGILGRLDLDVSMKRCETIPLEKKENLYRGLEKSRLWKTDVAVQSRYARYRERL